MRHLPHLLAYKDVGERVVPWERLTGFGHGYEHRRDSYLRGSSAKDEMMWVESNSLC